MLKVCDFDHPSYLHRLIRGCVSSRYSLYYSVILKRTYSNCTIIQTVAQSDQSFYCSHGETLHPKLPKMRPVNILIRLRECAGWSVSSLGAHVWRFVIWRWGSFYGLSNSSSVTSDQTDRIGQMKRNTQSCTREEPAAVELNLMISRLRPKHWRDWKFFKEGSSVKIALSHVRKRLNFERKVFL